MMYQIVGRHFEPWNQLRPAPQKPVLDVTVEYDHTELTTTDVLKARATLRYNGARPTYMVIVDLGIPPGFAADPADFTRLVRSGENDPPPMGAKRLQTTIPIEKVTTTARQVTLYLGDVKPGDALTVEYTLRPKFPVKVQTPATVVYEYYTPTNRATAKPVELTVREAGVR
jgi:hypothetical protein